MEAAQWKRLRGRDLQRECDTRVGETFDAEARSSRRNSRESSRTFGVREIKIVGKQLKAGGGNYYGVGFGFAGDDGIGKGTGEIRDSV